MYARYDPKKVSQAPRVNNVRSEASDSKKRKRGSIVQTDKSAQEQADEAGLEHEPKSKVEEKVDRKGNDLVARRGKDNVSAERTTTSGNRPKEAKKKRKRERTGADTEQDEDLRTVSTGAKTRNEDGEESAHRSAIAVREGKKEGKKRKEKRLNGEPPISKDKQEDVTDKNAEGDADNSKHKSMLAKYHKSLSMAQTREEADTIHQRKEQPIEAPETTVAGLEPLAQPQQSTRAPYVPSFTAAPKWIAQPTRVSSESTVPLQELPIHARTLKHLADKGYKDAFSIQAAVLPMLLPGERMTSSDVVISAATGSGKTLAYVLPLVEHLRSRVVTRLKAVIVVPTRELVTQAQEVCELCISGTNLKIATAVGNRPLKQEQALLVEKGQVYDLSKSDSLLADLNTKDETENISSWNEDDDADPILPGHKRQYSSKVDILIATPGRLVDHIKSTPGFSLRHVEWLVIDEADRLLGQHFQDWLNIVLENVKRPEHPTKDIPRLYDIFPFKPPRPKRLRKIMLSATMTKDLTKLRDLNLYRPTLVVLENANANGLRNQQDGDKQTMHDQGEESFDLPALLEEYASPVGDGSKKPLYLQTLLRTRIGQPDTTKPAPDEKRASPSSSSDPDTSSLSSDTDSDSDSDNDSTTDTTSNTSSADTPTPSTRAEVSPRKLANNVTTSSNASRGVLVFTRSNESALRLTRLLSLLDPASAFKIGTLTSTKRSSERRKTLKAFTAGNLTLLIASDLVSRGMDIPDLGYIVNYDVPSSVRSYVHRVGRTARANKKGVAWTLIANKEAAWFWRDVAKGPAIRRSPSQHIRRVRLNLDDSVDEAYERALKTLGDEVRREV